MTPHPLRDALARLPHATPATATEAESEPQRDDQRRAQARAELDALRSKLATPDDATPASNPTEGDQQ